MKRPVGVRKCIAATPAAGVIVIALAGCGERTVNIDEGADAAPELKVETLSPDAPPLPGETECKVVITTGIRVPRAQHITDFCAPIEYATNPPSGGDHWPKWAAYKAYQVPVPREMYVHNMEHGAVVLSYRCKSACSEIAETLESVRAGATSDPRCLTLAGGPEARLVLTPDEELDTPVAASSWGATYTATCLDKPSLARFVAENYAKGTEDTCAGGIDIEDPSAATPRCGDAGAPDGGTPDGGAPGGGGSGGGG